MYYMSLLWALREVIDIGLSIGFGMAVVGRIMMCNYLK